MFGACRRLHLGVSRRRYDWRMIASEDTGAMFEVCASLGTNGSTGARRTTGFRLRCCHVREHRQAFMNDDARHRQKRRQIDAAIAKIEEFRDRCAPAAERYERLAA